MKRIRILLAELPRMLREIVESAVSTQPDMEIVSEVGDGRAPRESSAASRPSLAGTDADVVILGMARADEARTYDPLLYRRPHLKILAITGEGRAAFLYELRPQAVPIGDVSTQGLVDAIRASATPAASEVA